jgi:hypothetical protein
VAVGTGPASILVVVLVTIETCTHRRGVGWLARLGELKVTGGAVFLDQLDVLGVRHA